MTRKTIAMAFMLLLASAVFAVAGEDAKIKGYVVDNACASRWKADAGVDKAKGHSVKCALMPPCSASGFSVVTDEGKMYKLDDSGNAKVKELLGKTKTEKGFAVNIEGTVEGDTIKVKNVSEAM